MNDKPTLNDVLTMLDAIASVTKGARDIAYAATVREAIVALDEEVRMYERVKWPERADKLRAIIGNMK